MRSATTYQYFLDDDFTIIQEEFNKAKGLSVETADDVCTYQGWVERKRRVKRGEKSVKFQSSKPYAQPLYRNGAPKLDDKGKQMFGKYHKQFNLFHYKQTEPLTLS